MSDLIERAREASTLKYQYHTIHVPTILIRMADEADKAAAELSALQALHAAGSAPYDAEIDRLQKRNVELTAEVAALRADAERYLELRKRIRHSHATADGTHFSGEGITVDFPPPGRIYITNNQRAAFDTAIDTARGSGNG